MARINAGKYRHVVTFQKLKEANQNEYGETSVNADANWEDAFVARVGIFPISGRDALIMDDVRKAEISHRIVLRYIQGVNSQMRIKFGSRIFEITSPPVNTLERNDELLLFCKERDILSTGVNVFG